MALRQGELVRIDSTWYRVLRLSPTSASLQEVTAPKTVTIAAKTAIVNGETVVVRPERTFQTAGKGDIIHVSRNAFVDERRSE